MISEFDMFLMFLTVFLKLVNYFDSMKGQCGDLILNLSLTE